MSDNRLRDVLYEECRRLEAIPNYFPQMVCCEEAALAAMQRILRERDAEVERLNGLLDKIADMEGREGMTDAKFVDLTLGFIHSLRTKGGG